MSPDPLADLATLLAAAYLRLVQAERQRARHDAVSPPKNGRVSVENSLDPRAKPSTPCVGGRRQEGVR